MKGVPGIDKPATPTDSPVLSILFEEWLEKRKKPTGPGGTPAARSWRDDFYRWKNHLCKAFGTMRPGEVDAALIKGFIESKQDKLDSATIHRCISLLSTFYSGHLVPTYAPANPVKSLPKATRKLYHKAYDRKMTPFIHKMEDVRRILHALESPYSIAYAVGVYAGLRTGEVLGLFWADIDFERRRIHVQRQVTRNHLGPIKDNDSRILPLVDELYPFLRAWKLRTGGSGLVFTPEAVGRGGLPGHPPQFVTGRALNVALKAALDELKIPLAWHGVWYAATRHTFASHWAMEGRSMRKLQEMMGHASIETTEKYAHLLPDGYDAKDLAFGKKAVG